MKRLAFFVVASLAIPAMAGNPTTQRSFAPSAKESNDAQLWHSSRFNGQTVWNRPAIFDTTVHAVKDTRTGYMFYYRDFANTVKVPLGFQSNPTAGTGHRVRDLDLLDDSPKPAK